MTHLEYFSLQGGNMAYQIPEMQKVKEKYPQYKDYDDVTLLNSIVRKYPVYKPVALRVGDEIRKQRAEQVEFEKQATPNASTGAKLTRTQMRGSGFEELDTAQYIQANRHRFPPVAPEDNFFSYSKKASKALALPQREAEVASHGTIAQFEDAMTVGISMGMVAHPAATVKMLAKFGGLEGIMHFTGLREKLQNIKNVEVRDAADVIVFGLMGLVAGVKWGKGKPKNAPVIKNKQVKVTLDSALAKAAKAMKSEVPEVQDVPKVLKPKPIEKKAPTVSSKVEVTKTPVVDIKIAKTGDVTKEGVVMQQKWHANGKDFVRVQDKITKKIKVIDVTEKVKVVDKAQEILDDATIAEAKKVAPKEVKLIEDRIDPTKAERKALVDRIKNAKTDKERIKLVEEAQDLIKREKKHDIKVDKEDAVIEKLEKDIAPKASIEKVKAKEKFRDELIKRREKKPKTTKPKDQVSTLEGDMIEVSVRGTDGKVRDMRLNSKQLRKLKNDIEAGDVDLAIVDKLKKPKTAKEQKLEALADKIIEERTPKDIIKDIGDALGGKEGSSKLSPEGKRAQQDAINRLVKDAKKSGKELDKYLKENLKLDNASAGAIVKAAGAHDTMVAQIKDAKNRPVDNTELDAKPRHIADEIIQEKMRNAKSESHRKRIAKKYNVKYETPTSDPAIVKDVPAIDPLMEKDTLFNPKDKSSMKINDKINANLDKQRARAIKLQEKLKAKGKESKFLNDWVDTTFGLQGLQERTGAPVYSKSYLKGVEISNIHQRTTDTITTALAKGLREGSQSPEGDARIIKWITKREGKLTAEEMKAAHKIQKIVRDFKPMIKYLTMRDWIAGRIKVPKQFRKFVTQGRRILKKQGTEALEVWVKDKPFGVIEGDTYLPANVIRGVKVKTTKQSPYEIILPQTKQRTAAEQTYDDTIPLLQRMHQYVESTLRKYYFQDYLLETKQTIDPYNLSAHDKIGFEKWLSVLQGQGIPVGPAGKFARKARGQFFKTVLFDPYKWGRNLVQNVAFLYQNYPLSTNIVKTAKLIGRKTSEVEREFFNTHIAQLGALRREYFYLYEGKTGKGIMSKIDGSAIKVAEAYTQTDTFNRWWAFKHALAGIERDMSLYKNGKITWDTFSKRQGIGSMTDLEVKHIMGLKPEQAKLQIARFITEKTHVRYKKHERGIAAMSELGEAGSSLLQFPRTVVSRYMDGVRMMTKGRTHHEQWAGANLLLGLGVMSWVANEVLYATLGSKKYYDPELKKEVEARPYGLLQAITGINFGGAQLAQVKDFSRGVKLIAEIISEHANGKFEGAKGHKRRMTLVREVLKIGDRFTESFQPYWRKALDAVESIVDKKSYKLLTTSFDILTKRKSALSRNKVERDIMTKIRHALFGTEKGEEKAFDPSTLPVAGQFIEKDKKKGGGLLPL